MAFLARYQQVWRIPAIRWLAISRLFANLSFYSAVLVQYERSRGLNFTQIFLMESVLSVTLWIGTIPTGLLADAIGYRRVILLGRGLMVVSLIVFIFAHNLGTFLASDAIAGLAMACLDGCEQALAYESIAASGIGPAGSATTFALLAAATQAGFFLGLATGSFMGAINPSLPVIITLIPGVLAFFLTARLPVFSTVPASLPQNASHEHRPRRIYQLARATLAVIRRHPALAALSVLEGAAFAGTNAIFWYNQPYFGHAGIPVFWYGPLTAAGVALGMLLALTLPWVRHRLALAVSLALACLVPGLTYLGLAVTHQAIVAFAGVAIVIAAQSWRLPLMDDTLNQALPHEARATILSSLSFLGTCMGIVLNPLIGVAGDHGLRVTGIALGSGLLILAVAGGIIGRAPVFRVTQN